MKKVVVFGYGNVGKSVVDTLKLADDLELVGIVDKSSNYKQVGDITVAADINAFDDFDVAILSLPSRIVPEMAAQLLEKGVCTADSFDIHARIPEVRETLDMVAKKHGAASIIAAGWDPGTDSIIRTLFEAMAPSGITYTNFGPGMSMGHTVVAKAINGVKDALSMTIPAGTGIHRRMVYIELENGCTEQEVATKIKADEYFAHDETHVIAVDNIKALKDVGHGVHIERKGVSGNTHNQLFEYSMKINNPALTAQVLVNSARAVLRQQPGCYTLIEIPPVDFLCLDRKDAVRLLV